MSKKVLLISNDESLINFVNTTVLTLTKLNNFTVLKVHTSQTLPPPMEADIVLADMGTFDVLPNLKKLSTTDDAQIIAITAKNTSFPKDEIFAAGCTSIMSRNDLYNSLTNMLMI